MFTVVWRCLIKLVIENNQGNNQTIQKYLVVLLYPITACAHTYFWLHQMTTNMFIAIHTLHMWLRIKTSFLDKIYYAFHWNVFLPFMTNTMTVKCKCIASPFVLRKINVRTYCYKIFKTQSKQQNKTILTIKQLRNK